MEKTGPPVDKGIADLINGLMCIKFDKKKAVEVSDKPLKPENCELMKQPKVNLVNYGSQSRDVKAYKSQDLLLGEVTPIRHRLSLSWWLLGEPTRSLQPSLPLPCHSSMVINIGTLHTILEPLMSFP